MFLRLHLKTVQNSFNKKQNDRRIKNIPADFLAVAKLYSYFYAVDHLKRVLLTNPVIIIKCLLFEQYFR